MSFISIYPIIEFRHNHSSGKEMALLFNETTESNSVPIAIPGDQKFFEYYVGNYRMVNCPEYFDSQSSKEFITTLDDNLAKGSQLYLFSECFEYPRDEYSKDSFYQYINDTFYLEYGESFFWEGSRHTENILYVREVAFIKLIPKSVN